MKELLGAVSLKRAAEGNKDTMWTDPERYPSIADADLVRFCFELAGICLDYDWHQGIQAVEVELTEELKSSQLLHVFVVSVLQSFL